MAAAFDRTALLDAFDQIGRAAVEAGAKLQIAVYGGSALMLASNFRFSTEDVDVSELPKPLPAWLAGTLEKIARRNGWSDDWFNDGVVFHLSPFADQAADHLEFGSFPRDGGSPGLVVSVPSAEYLLALKLKAVRIADPVRGDAERLDILNLMRVVGISTPERSSCAAWKVFSGQRGVCREAAFLLKHMSAHGAADAPKYPG